MKALLTALVGSALLGGCVVGSDSSQPSSDPSTSAVDPANTRSTTTLPPIPEDEEYAFFRDRTFTFQIPGFFTAQAETFFIWNLGTAIQHNAPYPSSTHGKLFAVFAQGPAGATHHVDGQPNFDHYHIITQEEGIRTFDGFLVFPGPNFNAATFVPPRSESGLNAAIAAGVLNPPLTSTAAGLGPLVIKVPVSEFEH
ncbi:MAG TPA: hypothetical protein VF516_26665 [Kofleriaceae bacterium]